MHSAHYDSDGNIILPPEGEPVVRRVVKPAPAPSFSASETPPSAPVERLATVEWLVVEDDPANLPAPTVASPISEPVPERREALPIRRMVMTQISTMQQTTRDTLREGRDQYHVSILGGRSVLSRMYTEIRLVLRAIWHFLAQPVWVPTRKKKVKQYSRGTLFILDIVRFGGTFAVIFGILFVTLNYKSFWQIASAQVETVLEPPSIEGGVDAENKQVAETLNASESENDAGRERGELLSFLPPVGPPENRVLIPKLGLNVPLVEPSTEALLRQDWPQVETDIQHALEKGVVHYPGTARPGQAGNFFITGHSSYYPWAAGDYKNVFARLHSLDVGDEYWVYFRGDKHRYIVREKKEVLPSDITVLDQPENKRISTLMTCTPVGTTLRRLIVVSQEVDPVSGEPLAVGERGGEKEKPKVQLEALPI